MEEFDSGDNFTRPTPLHKCCDVCSLACKCEDCIAVQAQMSIGSEALSSQPSHDHQFSPSKQLALQSALEAYRLSLCANPSCPPLFGIEVVTSIPDCLILDIVQNTWKYSTVNDFLSCGLSHSHAVELCKIVSDICQ